MRKVLIITGPAGDAQGWGDLSSSGNSNLATPNIDGIALAGAKFNNLS